MKDNFFPHYLSTKRGVDDRALNSRVWNALSEALREGNGDAPVRILEVGGGIGTMLQRMMASGLIGRAEYHLIDAEQETLAKARENLVAWAKTMGYRASQEGENLCLFTHQGWVEVRLETADLYDFAARHRGKQAWNVVVANAVLDLLDIPLALERLRELACPGGWFYFSINFDGLTILEPPVEPELDEQIVRLYHRSMDERVIDGEPIGDSRAGRHLFTHLRDAGLEIVEAGGSDWVVFAREGRYLEDEADFLRYILRFFEDSLANRADLDPARFQDWLAARRAQIERGELVYIAHQLDFLTRKPL